MKRDEVLIGQRVTVNFPNRAGEIATVTRRALENRNCYYVVFDDGITQRYNAFWLEPAPTDKGRAP